MGKCQEECQSEYYQKFSFKYFVNFQVTVKGIIDQFQVETLKSDLFYACNTREWSDNSSEIVLTRAG